MDYLFNHVQKRHERTVHLYLKKKKIICVYYNLHGFTAGWFRHILHTFGCKFFQPEIILLQRCLHLECLIETEKQILKNKKKLKIAAQRGRNLLLKELEDTARYAGLLLAPEENYINKLFYIFIKLGNIFFLFWAH